MLWPTLQDTENQNANVVKTQFAKVFKAVKSFFTLDGIGGQAPAFA